MRDAKGRGVAGAVLELTLLRQGFGGQGSVASGKGKPTEPRRATTGPNGFFAFAAVPSGPFTIAVRWAGRTSIPTPALEILAGGQVTLPLAFTTGTGSLRIQLQGVGPYSGAAPAASPANLGSRQVSNLPLEQRDSTKLLLLAAGTTTTSGTGGNFTQQYSIHGQRGTQAVFALDGADTTDPELGGATISEFNLDAIQQIDSRSGVMPASIGEGAAGYTNVISKSGTDQFHGVLFEFLRNSALDARNYFDRTTLASPGRIPPFQRNEFGLTAGGPLLLPGLYDGRSRTFFFFEYQGLRQVQGTTQVLPVPTAEERQGLDTTAFPGDTLYVPIDPQIQPLLAIYPLPNDPGGTYGARTYATDSKVTTTDDQFSGRLDQRISSRSRLMGRFTLENIVGPTTNPAQTAISPSYAQLFSEGYRSFALNYVRTSSPSLTMATTIGFIRSTPLYSSIDQMQPGITFANNLYVPIDSEAGGSRGTWGNLLQVRQTVAVVHGVHSFQWGAELRFNRDTAVFAGNVNGSYGFGGGPVYSPVAIPSASGSHNIAVGQLLPDTVTAFLTATPYTYNRTVGGRGFPQGDRIAEAGIDREAYNFFFLDNWRVTRRLLVDYGLRYEVEPAITEPHDMTSGPIFLGSGGVPVPYYAPGATEELVVNPQPGWSTDWNGWGPRIGVAWQVRENTIVHAGAGITTLLTFPFPNTALMNGFPYEVPISATAQFGNPIPFSGTVSPLLPPAFYTPQGNPVYPNGTSIVAPNTPVDVTRFEQDLAAFSGHQIQPVEIQGQSRDFKNGYTVTYTLGIQQEWRDFALSATYIGIAGVGLQGVLFPNNYAGASPGFAPFSILNSSGQFIGGFGPETVFANAAHSTYHAGEFVLRRLPTRWGLGFTASYTFSRSLDNAISGFGGGGGSGPVIDGRAQNPQDLGLEKGPSSSNVPQNLSFSVSFELPSPGSARPAIARAIAAGWELMGIGQFSSGLPFSVFSGVQQTGYGDGGGDRPDQIGNPAFSTSRKIREDYFGLGANNASYFSIPIHVPNGSGPFDGRPGTLGRNTFVGPPLRNFDIALFKDFPLSRRGTREAEKLEFRAEAYNILNIVNFGLPNNVLTGSGFGIIGSTSSNSRQMQFSLKLMY